MKFITSAVALTAFVRSEDGLAPRKFNSIVAMAHNQITTTHDKNTFGDMINKYGCHCFPNGSKAAGGSGPAVNAVDGLCKKLSKCHKCIQLEYGEDAVDVNDGRYTWGENDDGTLNCDKNNNNPARRALCECDRNFAYQMKVEWDDASWNNYYWLNNRHARQNEVFDYDETCQPAGNGSGTWQADVCCGDSFPNKEPYDSSQRGCCSSTVFNLFTQECCGNGSIGSIGSC